MDIGFIGLGNMGAPMARRLVEAGHRLTVYDTRQELIGNLTALGAVAARSPAEVADAAETVMASLPTPDIVLAVATGPRGVIEGKRVRRFVDLSTTGAVMAKRIFEALRENAKGFSPEAMAPLCGIPAETLREVTGKAPIGLYDDVFAELDDDRQARLLGLIQETLPGQSIVTAPRESEVPGALLERPRWRMKGGRIAA